MERETQMSDSQIRSKNEIQGVRALVKRTDKEKPKVEDVRALRKMLERICKMLFSEA